MNIVERKLEVRNTLFYTIGWPIFVGTNDDISVDWPNTQNFVLANIHFVHYQSREFIDPLLFSRIKHEYLQSVL